MAKADDQSSNERTPENEPMVHEDDPMADADELMADEDEVTADEAAIEVESSTNEPALENYPNVNEEISNTDEVGSEYRSTTDEATPEHPSTTNVTSTSSKLGLLALPAELRVIVLRHLLLANCPIPTGRMTPSYQPLPAMLHTSRLIRQEAFQVFYAENSFFIGALNPTYSILSNQQIRDTIQNVHYDEFDERLDSSPAHRQLIFIDMIREFGSPAIVRHTLNIVFRIDHRTCHKLLHFFVRGMPRFTNFRTIRFRFLARSLKSPEGNLTDPETLRARNLVQAMHSLAVSLEAAYCVIYERALTPVFGPPRPLDGQRGLEFHPQDYLNYLPPKVEVDWMEYLDGIRLDWNRD